MRLLSNFLKKYLFNSSVSIRCQILVSFSMMIVLAIGVTLAICYGLLYSTGITAYDSVTNTIVSTTEAASYAAALDISSSINQQFLSVGQSVCISGALYGAALISKGANNLLSPRQSYREYNFVGGCVSPQCPSDYGPLSERSRVPHIDGYTNGSVEDSSVYMFYGTGAIRDDTTWQSVMNQHPTAQAVLDSLAYQDIDLTTMYHEGSNSSMFFYLSARVGTSYNGYVALHRTFPGMNKGNDLFYNPPSRSWFTKAPVGGLYLYGPYLETFTRQQVITLSSRQVVTTTTEPVVVVASAVVLLSTAQEIVHSASYTNGGFGAVLTYSDLSVVVWKQGIDTYDYVNGRFSKIADIDSLLAQHDLKSKGSFEYHDVEGISWIVSVVPFFETTDGQSSKVSSALIMLVFAQKDLAEQSLPALQSNIDDTTGSITVQTIIIAGACAGALLFALWCLVIYITSPLETISRISKDVIDQSALELQKRDYSGSLSNSFFLQRRSDEIGALTNEFFNVLVILHNQATQKKKQPKYPPNPFYLAHVWRGQDGAPIVPPPLLRWDEFTDQLAHVGTAPAEAVVTNDEKPVPGMELDVLASLSIAPPEAVNEKVTGEYAPVQPNEAGIDVNDIDVFSVTKSLGPVPLFFSIKFKFYWIVLTLCACVLAIMIITIISLRGEGDSWMEETGLDLEAQQLSNLHSISESKAVFVQAFMVQIIVQLRTLVEFMSGILNNELTTPALINGGKYLPSYSILPNDPYSSPESSSNDYSSYFYKDSATCSSANCYQRFHQRNLTETTSLLDFKLGSYIYPGTLVSVMQVGLQSTGFVRSLPYARSNSLGFPTSCLINDQTQPVCATAYASSLCSGVGGSFPAYDARCRNWYQMAVNGGDPHQVYFQSPRRASNGQFIVTAATPIRSESTNSILAVINFNILMTGLSDLVNNVPILKSGYSYLLNTANSTIVVHPRASATCNTLTCVEGFSAAEYQVFHDTVLLPMQQGLPISSSYQKGGKEWRIAVQSIRYKTISYSVVATVSTSEIFASSTSVQKKIDASVVGMSVALALCLSFVLSILLYVSVKMAEGIVEPILQLQSVLESVVDGDLTYRIGYEATSLDMLKLLEAFSNLMIALRFGSESFARGRVDLAVQAFQEALQLYTMSGNKAGIAAANNNLGAAYLEEKSFAQSEKHFVESIAMGEKLIEEIGDLDPKAAAKLRRTISDRKGNLVLLKLNQGDFGTAFEMLEQLLLEDKRSGYIMGCIVKQGLLGHYYLRQSELKSAERVFSSALEFVRNPDERLFEGSWNYTEAGVAEQVALFNVACLFQSQDPKLAESIFIESLSRGVSMHQATTTKALSALLGLFTDAGKAESAKAVLHLAEANGISLQRSGRGSGKPKRVAFILDYSGSMSGSKIRVAIENLTSIVENNISDKDSVLIMHFTDQVFVDFPLQQKQGRDSTLKYTIASLNKPSGSTALYDAISRATSELRSSHSNADSDWIIALTDGEDNRSKMKVDGLISELKDPKNKSNVIIIGIGSDVDQTTLTSIVAATSKGAFVFASGDKQSIDDAFGAAMSVVEAGQVVLED